MYDVMPNFSASGPPSTHYLQSIILDNTELYNIYSTDSFVVHNDRISYIALSILMRFTSILNGPIIMNMQCYMFTNLTSIVQ